MSYWGYLPAWITSCFRPARPSFIAVSTDLESPFLPATTPPTSHPLSPLAVSKVRILVQNLQEAARREALDWDASKECIMVNTITHAMNLRNVVSAFVLIEIISGFLTTKPEAQSALAAYLAGEIVTGVVEAACTTPYNAESVRKALVYFGLIKPANEREAHERHNFLTDSPWVIAGSIALGVLAAASQVMLTILNSTWFLEADTAPMLTIGALIGAGYLLPSITRAGDILRPISCHLGTLSTSTSSTALYAGGKAVLYYGIGTAISLNYSYNIGLFFVRKLFSEAAAHYSPWMLFCLANLLGHPFAVSQIGVLMSELSSKSKCTGLIPLLLSFFGTCLPPAVLAFDSYRKNGMAESTAGTISVAVVAALSLTSLLARAPPIDRALRAADTTTDKVRVFSWTSATGSLAFQRTRLLSEKTLNSFSEWQRCVAALTEANVQLAEADPSSTDFARIQATQVTAMTHLEAVEVEDALKTYLRAAFIKSIYAIPGLSAIEERAFEARAVAPIAEGHPLHDLMDYFHSLSVPEAKEFIRVILGVTLADTLLARASTPALTVVIGGDDGEVAVGGAGAMPERPLPPPVTFYEAGAGAGLTFTALGAAKA